MRVIEVLEPGLLTTVQDLGREGFGPLGVSPSGAADAISLRLGNRLVGNHENAAGLEMTLLGGTFVFSQSCVVAVTGSNFSPTVDDECVSLWTSIDVRAGQTLRLGPTRSGARAYLCIQGGIEVKPFLNSASTHVLSGLGGHEGRALRKGDTLKIGPGSSGFHHRTFSSTMLERLSPRKILRVTRGPQSDSFAESSQKLFYGAAYRVGEQSNRMGIRLQGAP